MSAATMCFPFKATLSGRVLVCFIKRGSAYGDATQILDGYLEARNALLCSVYFSKAVLPNTLFSFIPVVEFFQQRGRTLGFVCGS
ncbi:MAG TPA: hypothetical protein DCE41_21880 [Cytophagales bacterium]|nr:hypothetical protein [Cytophagales bacterium]